MSTVTDSRLPTQWRAWLPEGGLALAVLVLALVEASRDDADQWPVLIGVPIAVLLARRAPGAALTIVWVVGALHVILGAPVLGIEAAIAVVAFGCARWGRTATVIVSGLSIPAAAMIAAVLVVSDAYGYFRQLGTFRELVHVADSMGGDTLLVGAVLLGSLVLVAPWLLGLALRFGARARDSKVSQLAAEEDAASAVRETEQAREIASLREEQARMARDVHDVVGHSLAVILAQAESAQYVDDADSEMLKKTMATIATSARSSLQDVRHVLTTTKQESAPVRTGGLDSLVAGVRSGGQAVTSTEVGPAQPLPPELEVVAYRVLQEMLTNAMKHGRRDTPVECERHWDGELRIEVRNVIRSDDITQPLQLAHTEQGARRPRGEPAADQAGQGIEGMRRRLTAVGGRLDVRRREEPTGATFTTTAWLPVRGTR